MNLSKLHQIISSNILKNSDLGNEDNILDHRDEDPFDSAWIDMYQTINQEYEKNKSKIDEETVDSIRKIAFFSSDQFFGSHEISSYISDDFDLIAKGIITNSQDKRITWLLDYYINNGVPHSEIEEHEKSISDY
ncbi:hypothetical protein LRP50_24445 [Enterovibrio sp. ZSDZ42]|uniref:Uncharacterized protein n=1 Tax=Enterovibrio gelatinilyticus TaxID=2899819 RepID=A0ABT5R8I1_9GAMM|nr:hypothetical protein [Enterovibrio sp. ZSDZ42]MDD1796274.1 hypothetical protein [Enterovibrio sp. ZSDZ42]